jgi:murein L,D-transpeptidase YcbB/YkuD
MSTHLISKVAGTLKLALISCAVSVLILSSMAVPARAAPADQSGDALRSIVTTGHLADLRWPDFPDYRDDVQAFYDAGGYQLAWTKGGQPTSQARTVIDTLRRADDRGLNAEDYDASRWEQRLSQLNQPDAAARFDVALTVCVMRYLSDLHLGRVNPKKLKFAIAEKTYRSDLVQFVRTHLVNGQSISSDLELVEPQYPGYQRTKAVLQQYLELAQHGDGPAVPAPKKSLDPGSHFEGIAQLTQRLALLSDLPAGASVPPGDIYQEPLVEAVKRFQDRHGLMADGRLGAQTVKELNTPLSARIEQLRLTLERWRWLPHEFPLPPLVVNIPEFRLRAFDANHQTVLSMNVIVGKALRHETPVFQKDMQYVVFRPYWNVPQSIQRSEIVPAIQRNRNYVADKNYEVTTHNGQVVTSGAIDDEVLEQLRTGKLAVRQKPGPTNALGLVKLIFPNEYNVYLHSTPSQQLFSRSRRDFSHGCIRVEKPDELSAWALRDLPEWNLEKVRAAMQQGKDNQQVNLPKPIPVLILYGTAVINDYGAVHFYDDIYGHDADLRKALAKGYPYGR